MVLQAAPNKSSISSVCLVFLTLLIFFPFLKLGIFFSPKQGVARLSSPQLDEPSTAQCILCARLGTSVCTATRGRGSWWYHSEVKNRDCFCFSYGEKGIKMRNEDSERKAMTEIAKPKSWKMNWTCVSRICTRWLGADGSSPTIFWKMMWVMDSGQGCPSVNACPCRIHAVLNWYSCW